MLEDKQEIWRDLHRLSCDSHRSGSNPSISLHGGGGRRLPLRLRCSQVTGSTKRGQLLWEQHRGDHIGFVSPLPPPASLFLAGNFFQGQRESPEEVVGWGVQSCAPRWCKTQPAPGQPSPLHRRHPAGAGCDRAQCLTFTYSLPDSRPSWWLEGRGKIKIHK